MLAVSNDSSTVSGIAPLEVKTNCRTSNELADGCAHLQTLMPPAEHPAHDLRWLAALRRGLGHRPIVIEAREGEQVTGLLPLALVKSPWFGRFLVSLPYVNSAGPIMAPTVSNPTQVKTALIERAIALASELGVRYLELRCEHEIEHAALTEKNTSKVHMRLALPTSADALLASFKSKLRSQLKGRSSTTSKSAGAAPSCSAISTRSSATICGT